MSIEKACSSLKKAGKVCVLTGAGVSAESGIPTFREAAGEGFWEKFNPMDLASPEAFAKDPGTVWEWYEYRRNLVRQSAPNAAHESLARMQKLLPGLSLITQNVDDLHQRAGSQSVTTLHGSLFEARGVDSNKIVSALEPFESLPPSLDGEMLRPNIVWFGESLDSEVLASSFAKASEADVMLVVGTSLQVYPAALLLPLALDAGAEVFEINPLPSQIPGTHVLRGQAAEVLPRIEAGMVS